MSRIDDLLELFTRYVAEEAGDRGRAFTRRAGDGLSPVEIGAALEWHTGPENVRHLETARGDSFQPSVRVFSGDEFALLDASARGYIIEETFARRIAFERVEEVVDRLRLIEAEPVNREHLKALLALDNPEPDVHAEIRTRFVSRH